MNPFSEIRETKIEHKNGIGNKINAFEKNLKDVNKTALETNDNPEGKSAIKNKLDGLAREEEVAKELEKQYPEKEGYQILRERELCDKDGKPVVDEQTGQKRRVDFVVVKDGKVVDMVEVTSKTAPKREQLSKEYRIRDNGGNYIKDYDGNICRIPDNVETRVERRD